MDFVKLRFGFATLTTSRVNSDCVLFRSGRKRSKRNSSSARALIAIIGARVFTLATGEVGQIFHSPLCGFECYLPLQQHLSIVMFDFAASGTTGASGLYWRTRNRAVAAKDAAVAWQWPKQNMTSVAFAKKQAGVGGHFKLCGMATCGACQSRARLDLLATGLCH